MKDIAVIFILITFFQIFKCKKTKFHEKCDKKDI